MAGGAAGALINKAALANTPREVVRPYVFFAALAIAAAGGLHGYNSSNISGILKMHDFKESFDLGSYSTTAYANLSGWITSIIVLGGLIGSLTAAPFNDYLGRRPTLFIAAILYLVGCIMQISTSSNINLVIGARALQGYGGGIGSVCGSIYLAEIAPKAVRGLMGALFSTNVIMGVMVGYWANYGSILNISDDSHWQWRTPILVQFIPSIMILTMLPFVPESPRWYAYRGKADKCLKSLVRLRGLPAEHDFVVAEYSEIFAAAEAENAKKVSWLTVGSELVNDRSLMRRFVIAMLIQVGFNFSGGNSITYYQNAILDTVGIKGDDAYLFAGIYGLIKLLSVFIYALFCTERFGRRKMILVGGWISVGCVTWIAIYLGALNGNKAGGWVSVAALCLFGVGYGCGWSPNGFALPAELMPNRLRAKVLSIALGLQYLLNFLLVRFFPNMVAGIGADGPFIIFACVSAAILIFLFFALPEPKGVAIEHMHEIFDGHWYTNGLRGSRLNKALRRKEAADQATFSDAKPSERVEHLEEVKESLKPHEAKAIV